MEDRTVEFTVTERLVLLGFLQGIKASFSGLKALAALRADLRFSDEEQAAIGMHVEGDRFLWDEEKAEPVEIEVPQVARERIIRRLRELDVAEELDEQLLILWERFIGEEEPAGTAGE